MDVVFGWTNCAHIYSFTLQNKWLSWSPLQYRKSINVQGCLIKMLNNHNKHHIVLIMSDIDLLKNPVRSEYENDLTWNVI